MSAFEFKIRMVRKTRLAKAQRAAVLTPLIGEATTPDDVEKAFARLRRHWIRRLIELEAAGWVPAKDHFEYYRNCPPFSVITSRRAVRCSRSRVCPFCYARDFPRDCFLRLAWAVYGTLATRQRDPDAGVNALVLPRHPYRLLEVESTDRVPVTVAPQVLVDELRELRRFYPRPSCPDGAYRLDTVEPAERGWLVRRRLIILVGRGRPNPGVIPVNGTVVREHDVISRKILAGAVGRVLSYPVGVMRGDPGAAAAVLAAMSRFRTAVTYGVLRNGRERLEPAD